MPVTHGHAMHLATYAHDLVT